MIDAGRKLGLRIKPVSVKARDVQRMVFPLLVALRPRGARSRPHAGHRDGCEGRATDPFRAGTNSPQALDAEALEAEFAAPPAARASPGCRLPRPKL